MRKLLQPLESLRCHRFFGIKLKLFSANTGEKTSKISFQIKEMRRKKVKISFQNKKLSSSKTATYDYNLPIKCCKNCTKYK